MENTSKEIKAKNIDARIPEFYNRLNLLRTEFIDLSAHFRPQIDELFKNKVTKIKSTSFNFRYETGYETKDRLSPYRYLIFGLNPIDKILKVSNGKIKMHLGSDERGVNYGDIKIKCETFFAAVEEKIGKDTKIAHARAERKKLIDISTKIHDDLGKMILD